MPLLSSRDFERGFTMIEMLIVIVIIATLTAVAVPAFLDQRKAAYDTSVRMDAKSILISTAEVFVSTDGPLDRSTLTTQNPVNLSPGNDWEVIGDSDNFCVMVWNDDSHYPQDRPHVFDSTTGTAGEVGTGCPPGTDPGPVE